MKINPYGLEIGTPDSAKSLLWTLDLYVYNAIRILEETCEILPYSCHIIRRFSYL
ncbi:MAG: hypothetical protein ACTHME_00835 [Candidatus Nitrosocosmicus sp.]